MLIPSKIVLHCSATEDSGTKSWGAIRAYHLGKGWSDIGYHYGIEQVGEHIELLRGRPYWQRGAHCKADNRNFDSLGLCVVGNFDDKPPSPTIYAATLWALRCLCYAFWISPSDVYGHREFEKNKTCPGKMWDLDKLRDDIRQSVPEPDDTDAGFIIGVTNERTI